MPDSLNPQATMFSKITAEKVYIFPKEYKDDPGFPRSMRMTASEADYIMGIAPKPTHDELYGDRPHGHEDREKDYAEERKRLLTLEGHAWEMFDDIVLWAYPGTIYRYKTENDPPRAAKEVGPLRIVTDKDRQRQGMSYHTDKSGLKRAVERTQITVEVPSMRVIVELPDTECLTAIVKGIASSCDRQKIMQWSFDCLSWIRGAVQRAIQPVQQPIVQCVLPWLLGFAAFMIASHFFRDSLTPITGLYIS
ncbi:uncharacterized protein BDV14DRAFT_196226 [Aspergillus stella-maris]|uniref:uncharacterized protein n=1 Tax=Aspergillus stella-maris TaxID=1810926 RepID=UPI003CCCCE23